MLTDKHTRSITTDTYKKQFSNCSLVKIDVPLRIYSGEKVEVLPR